MKNKTFYISKELTEKEVDEKGFGAVEKTYSVDIVCKISEQENEAIPSTYQSIHEVKVYKKLLWVFKKLIKKNYSAIFIAIIPEKHHAIEIHLNTPYFSDCRYLDEVFDYSGTITSNVRIRT